MSLWERFEGLLLVWIFSALWAWVWVHALPDGSWKTVAYWLIFFSGIIVVRLIDKDSFMVVFSRGNVS